MGDPTRGLIHKFDVTRTDGTSEPGEKHDGCDYFVLDLTHDPHALPALKAYADSCREKFPLLARDLREKARAMALRVWYEPEPPADAPPAGYLKLPLVILCRCGERMRVDANTPGAECATRAAARLRQEPHQDAEFNGGRVDD